MQQTQITDFKGLVNLDKKIVPQLTNYLKEKEIRLSKELLRLAKNYFQNEIKASEPALLSSEVKLSEGTEEFIRGRVSTEVPAYLSFDVEGSIEKGKELIALYQEQGIERDRILIKLASTWEGGLAAKELEKEGIHCNLTLMFSLAQAVHCANAKATLISPFVGRILDWHKKAEGVEGYAPQQDPGVQSVTAIYHYYKKFDIPTQIMGASFRNKEEILELAGCDLLTISPSLLAELQDCDASFARKLEPKQSKAKEISAIELDEKKFRGMLNLDAMATEKLAEGIRNFAKDADQLKKLISQTYQLS